VKKALTTTVLQLVLALLLTIAPANPADAGAPDMTSASPSAGDRCAHPGKYQFVISRVRSKIVVGYAKRFYLSPGEVLREVRHVRRDLVVKAQYEADGGASLGASGAAKLLLKAEAHLNLNLKVFGSWNKATAITVDRTVSNPTGKNRKFVAFKATHQYAGRYQRLFCQKHPISRYPEWIAFGSGSWRSHETLEEGTLRCGAGTPGSVAALVSARHCG
jgi:hypothetical protein